MVGFLGFICTKFQLQATASCNFDSQGLKQPARHGISVLIVAPELLSGGLMNIIKNYFFLVSNNNNKNKAGILVPSVIWPGDYSMFQV